MRFLWNELRPHSRAWKRGAGAHGPCYDLCACRICWRGWSGFSWRTKLRWRLHYLVHRGWS